MFVHSPGALANNVYNKAVAQYNKGQFSKALVLFQESQEDGIQAANSAYYSALCYHQLKRLDMAKTAYLKVIKQFPKSRAARQAFLALSRIDPSIVKQGQSSYRKEKNSAYNSLPDKVVVHYRNLRGSGHIILPVRINGVRANMMFDTGASLTLCKQSFLDKLGVDIRNTQKSIRMRGVGGEVETRIGLANITLGKMTRAIPLMIEQDQATSRHNKNSFDSLPLLGQNYFKDFAYEIDDSTKTITFLKQEKRLVSNLEPEKNRKSVVLSDNEVPFYREGNHIIVKPKVNGRECEMILDTGAGTVAFADRHLALCGLNRPTRARSNKSRGVGGSREGYSFYVKSMSLGPIKRKNVRCALIINSRFSKPLLGQTFLQGLKYTINPSRNVIIFK